MAKGDLPPCSIGDKRFLTENETLAWLGIGEDTLKEWCRRGLPKVKPNKTKNGLVRYDKEDIAKFLEAFKE